MASSAIRTRIEYFASLQAAQRALGHSVDLTELAAVRAKSRELLIELKSISSGAQDGDDASSQTPGLVRIDRALAEQADHTRAILSQIDFAQLRATIPDLSIEHPEEVRGLIDLLLSGDLDDGKNLRILEYLITILATRCQGSHRILVGDPTSVSALAPKVAAELEATAGTDYLVAERFLEEATCKVLQEDDIGDIRDRVRRYKEALGRNILHPRVLATAVAYNTAMWNRVTTEIDSSRAIEELADALLFADSSQDLPAVEGDEPISELLSSKPFERLLSALEARVTDRAVRDAEAKWIVDALDLESLRTEDVTVFSRDEAGEATWLMRAAVLVGLLLQRRSALEDALRVLGVDPEVLATQCVDDLIARMSELARRRFAEGNYGGAFRLSEVKTHSLVTHSTGRSSASSAPLNRRSASAGAGPGAMYWVRQVIEEMPSWPVFLAISLMLAVVLLPNMVGRHTQEISRREELARISPFLERGRNVGEGPSRIFAGYLVRTWDYLDTEERHRVATEIGEHFAQLGTHRVVLKDVHREVVVEYEDHALSWLVPRNDKRTQLP